MAEKEELIELRFRIFDGTDIGHTTYAPSTTVASLKQKLVAEWPQGKTIVPKSVNDVKVIHAGRVLENRRTLADSKITFGNPPGEVITMHVVVQPTITKKRTGLSKLLCFFFFSPAMGLESGNSQKKTQNAQDFWKLQHGCEHYKRRCKIRAPCCDQIFSCRHCHNEATSSLSNPKERHEIVRHDIKQVICSICNTEQQVAQVCSNCGVKMGEYFCDICKFYDDETEKKQFHCDECGICRVGGRENFFHCQKCGSCYPVGIRNKHACVENSMKCSCPVCYEYLFDSVKGASIMKCGHAMHTECYSEMANQHQYRCPICSKTVFDVSNQWRLLDEEIKAMPMPEAYKYEVQILCNDCNKKSEAPFHILGHKCRECDSYNTRRISTPNLD